MTRKLINALKILGLRGSLSVLVSQLTQKTISTFEIVEKNLSGKRGIEIGGPSRIFEKRNLIPIYPTVSRLDGCNFAERTTWSQNEETYFFQKGKEKGKQFINEAADLKDIEDEAYDFLLASHVIEHVANPIKAINEWRRVVKERGFLLVVIPHKDGTFDHLRPLTAFGHIRRDFENNTEETDLTHLPEILRLHDLDKDPLAGSIEQFEKRARQNTTHRTLHHHVFDTELSARLLDYCRLQIVLVEAALPYHIILLGKKVTEEEKVDNHLFLSADARYRTTSPFHSDKYS